MIKYKPHVEKAIQKLDKQQKENILKKIIQIKKRPHGYKPLRKGMKGFFRVHVNKHFVLIFAIDHEKKLIDVQNYAHHDEVYKN